jgi:hypothetical protein
MNDTPPEIHAHILSYCIDAPKSVFNYLFVTRQLPSLTERKSSKIWDSLFYNALERVYGYARTPTNSSNTYWKQYIFKFPTLSHYKATMIKNTIASLPPGSEDDPLSALCRQIVSFVDHVSNGHSWYKHMSLLEPYNDPFVFRLDPTCNMRHNSSAGPLDQKANPVYTDYVDGDGTRIHYTWMPTADYRSRFGFLDYAQIDFENANSDCYRRFTLCDWPDGSTIVLPRINPKSTAPCTSAIHNRTHRYYSTAFGLAMDGVDLRDALPNDVIGDNSLARRHSSCDGQLLPENAILCIEAVVKVGRCAVEPLSPREEFLGEVRDLVGVLFPGVQSSTSFAQKCRAFLEWFFFNSDACQQSSLCLIAQRIHEQSTMARACASCYVDIGMEGIDEAFLAKLDSLVRCEVFAMFVRSVAAEDSAIMDFAQEIIKDSMPKDEEEAAFR